MKFVLCGFGFVAVATVMMTIYGCAQTSPSRVMEGFDEAAFRARRLVIIRSIPIRPIPTTAVQEYQSFIKDGLTDSAVAARVQVAFYSGLASGSRTSKIHIDTATKGLVLDDSCLFDYNGRVVTVRCPKVGLDTSALYLFTGPIFYERQLDFLPGVGTAPGRNTTRLTADMGWVIFDPRLSKAVAGGRLHESSTTFLLITNFITQSDWFTDARKLAGDLNSAVADLR
jgi:hypothetical protein